MNRQPVSPDSTHMHSRLRGATKSHSVCPYCAVGCSQNVYIKGGEVIDIESDPEGPINEGTLCPKGANTFQLVSNLIGSNGPCTARPTATPGCSVRSIGLWTASHIW
jgi:Molybdopterin oxidoreductase Fe4S4 domain